MKLRRFIAIAFAALIGLASSAQASLKAGDLDPAFNPGAAVYGAIYSIAVQPDGKLLIGGYFNAYGGAPRNGIARLNPDGSLDGNFQDGTDPSVFDTSSYYVRSIALQPDGKVVIGGYVSAVSNWVTIGIARLNTNGTLDTSFHSAAAGAEVQYCMFLNCDYYPGTVYSTAVQPDGKVLVGGDFTRYNLAIHNGVARLNADGSVDSGFQNPLPFGASINSIAIQSDGKVIVGGNGGIARLNTNGSRDTSFVATAQNPVYSVALQSGGKALIGGSFNSVNGTNRNCIARLNTNGTLDTTFQNGLSGADNAVASIAVQPNGKVLIGGYFTLINGVSRTRLARLNADGTLDASFQNGMAGTDDTVYSVARQSDGKVLLGGNFTTINGASLPFLARLYGTVPLVLNNFGVTSNQYGFNLTGESNTLAVVEASTNFVNWTPLSTNILGGAPFHISGSNTTTYQKRIYRARSP